MLQRRFHWRLLLPGLLCLGLLFVRRTAGFVLGEFSPCRHGDSKCTSLSSRGGGTRTLLQASSKSDTDKEGPASDPNDPMNPITKASWYAVEWFGKAFSNSNAPQDPTTTFTGPPESLQEALKRIQLDNDRSYFLSGQVDEELYAPDCVFRDPFVSFAGRDRFVTNLANLGSFITKYDAKVLQYNQPNETTIQTKIMVKLELNLPWKPILAWPWGVTYTIDPDTFCIVDHEESWDIEPWEGVKQIFRKPTLKL